jgi:hypothetical protein
MKSIIKLARIVVNVLMFVKKMQLEENGQYNVLVNNKNNRLAVCMG